MGTQSGSRRERGNLNMVDLCYRIAFCPTESLVVEGLEEKDVQSLLSDELGAIHS